MCELCYQGLSGKQMQYNVLKTGAKMLAMAQKENVIIYENENGYGYVIESGFYQYNPGRFVEGITPELQFSSVI